MKTSELTGAALDWAVAKCEGLTVYKDAMLGGLVKHGWWVSGMSIDPNTWHPLAMFEPSIDWSQGGPIIEREMIQLTPKCMVNPLHGWAAAYRSFDEDDDVYALHRKRGKTPLLAAMRCYVASKLGDDVDVPEELQ